MKNIILGLIFAVSSCSAVPSYAEANYESIQCIKFIEGDWNKVKPKLIRDLEASADRNQKMLIEDLGDNDLVVAGTNLYCENIPAKDVLTWVGL